MWRWSARIRARAVASQYRWWLVPVTVWGPVGVATVMSVSSWSVWVTWIAVTVWTCLAVSGSSPGSALEILSPTLIWSIGLVFPSPKSTCVSPAKGATVNEQ